MISVKNNLKQLNQNLTWDKGVGILLVLTVIFGWVMTPDFASTSNLGFVLQDIGEILIISLPMTFLIIAGEIDLSVASTLSLASSTMGYAYRSGLGFGIAVFIGILVSILCGAINGFLVNYLGLQSLAVTIGTMGLFRGLCFVLLGNQPVNQLPDFWANLGSESIPHTFLPWSVVIIIPSVIIAWVVLHRTRVGRWTFVTGISAEAARFSGIPDKRFKFWLFVATGFMSGVAAFVYTLRFASASPDSATGYELSVIAAVLFGGVSIAGGFGTMWGVLFSVLELGAIRSVLQLINFTANALQMVSGALLLFSVALPRVIEMLKTRREARFKPSVTSLTSSRSV
jgi:rhamnose transport system permease protein